MFYIKWSHFKNFQGLMFERVGDAVQINVYNAKYVKDSVYLGNKVNIYPLD